MKVVLACMMILCSSVMSGCTGHSYVVCRGETYCTAPMSHEEAMHAAQLKRAWADEALYVRPDVGK